MILVRTGKSLKKVVGRREEKKIQFRGRRWNHLVLETGYVEEGEKSQE